MHRKKTTNEFDGKGNVSLSEHIVLKIEEKNRKKHSYKLTVAVFNLYSIILTDRTGETRKKYSFP